MGFRRKKKNKPLAATDGDQCSSTASSSTGYSAWRGRRAKGLAEEEKEKHQEDEHSIVDLPAVTITMRPAQPSRSSPPKTVPETAALHEISEEDSNWSPQTKPDIKHTSSFLGTTNPPFIREQPQDFDHYAAIKGFFNRRSYSMSDLHSRTAKPSVQSFIFPTCNAFDSIPQNAFAFFQEIVTDKTQESSAASNSWAQTSVHGVETSDPPIPLHVQLSERPRSKAAELKDTRSKAAEINGTKHSATAQILEQSLPFAKHRSTTAGNPSSRKPASDPDGKLASDPDGKHGTDLEITMAVALELSSRKSSMRLTKEEEAIAKPYKKMITKMLPKDAKETLKRKMREEQVCDKIIHSLVGADSFDNETSLIEKTCNEKSCNEEGDAVAERYRKMLKMKVPKEAVRHKMVIDRVSKEIVDAVLGTSEPDDNKEGKPDDEELSKAYPLPAAPRRKSTTVALHWTPIVSENELGDSIWAASKRRKLSRPTPPEQDDLERLAELFERKATAAGIKGMMDSEHNGTKARLLDLHRANNISIILNAFRDFSLQELVETIGWLDPLQRIQGERLLFLPALLPRPKEFIAFKQNAYLEDELELAEQWFQRAVEVKRINAKAQVIVAMEAFEKDVSELQNMLQVRIRACNQILASETLIDILEMVLQIGNVMNEGCRSGGASGFKFDSLLKLTQTKSNDGSTTLLDYMVGLFVSRGQRDKLRFTRDVPDCHEASRASLSDLTASLNSLRNVVAICRREHKALKAEVPQSTGRKKQQLNKDSRSNRKYPQVSKFLGGFAVASKKWRRKKEKQPKKLEPEEGCVTAHTSKLAHASEMKLLGFERLDCFLKEAEERFTCVASVHEEAFQRCRDLSKYCGEGEAEANADSLLAVLWEFSASLDAAVKKHDKELQFRKAASRRALTTGAFVPS